MASLMWPGNIGHDHSLNDFLILYQQIKTELTMTNIYKLTVVALGLLVCAPYLHAAGDAEAGKQNSSLCIACHSEDGNSVTPQFPRLAGLGEAYLLKQMKDIKEGERVIAEMTGLLDSYSEQDLEDISAYYASQNMQLSGSKELTVKLNSGTEVDALVLGEQLYRYGNPESGVPACSGCHSPTGKGNAPAGYPRLSGQFSDYVEKQLKAFRAGERLNDGESQVMRQVAQRLSDAEIAAVANFTAGLH